MEIRRELRTYILENFLFTDEEDQLDDAVSLLDTGVIDSTGVLDIVGFIEENYEVQVPDTDLVPDNFETVDRQVAYIKRLLK